MNYTYAVVQDKEIMQMMTTPYLYVECIDTVSDITHYYNTDSQEIEHKMDLQYDIQINGLEVTITGLPTDLNVYTNNMHTQTDNEDLIIEYDIPGLYKIEISGRAEYLETTIDVEVSEPEPVVEPPVEGGE
ncbi:hypothetical protein J7J47_03550 [Halomonas sp. ISL-60]|uniref:hypothetical protein n=1 Tax=Halomonas sp. ISL-56 TaxID=2819149 RepID=UPI001BE5ABFE|nr:hypothetical protein [Halomonas sp. ISL-56]MBT2771304.1 hypothetical protein [Halomonas sp. ISL-60]MBT2800661.1 hypothetical protein [Halomonas sp. ISL-56]